MQNFLDQRLRSLQAGDVAAFLAPLSPSAQEVERPIAEGMASVPVEGLSLRLDDSSIPANAKTPINARVSLFFHYRGLPPDNEFRIGLNYTLVPEGESWRVTSSAVRPGSSLPIWATGPVQVQRTDHFLALCRPGLEDPKRILQEAEQARSQLEGKITFPLENAYLLVIARDETEYARMSSTTFGPVSAIAQVETSYEVTPGRIRVLSRKMVVNARKLHSEGSALETFRHELGHLVLAPLTRPFTPAWVSESAAMYLAGTRPVSIWQQGLSADRFGAISIEELTRARNLGEHASGRTASFQYAFSAAAAWYLVEAFGADRFWAFYRSYTEVPPDRLYELLPEQTASPRSDQAIELLAVSTTNEALQRFYGTTAAELDGSVRTWLAKQV